MNFEWKQKTGQYQTGYTLYLGKIPVAKYSWDSITPKAERGDNQWIGGIDLPRLRDKRLRAAQEMEMRSLIERWVAKWFEATKES